MKEALIRTQTSAGTRQITLKGDASAMNFFARRRTSNPCGSCRRSSSISQVPKEAGSRSCRSAKRSCPTFPETLSRVAAFDSAQTVSFDLRNSRNETNETSPPKHKRSR